MNSLVSFFFIAAQLLVPQPRLFHADAGLLDDLGYDTSPKAPIAQGLLQFSPDPSAQSSRLRSFYLVAPKVLDEQVLRKALTELAEFDSPDETASESLRLTRMTNELQPLGKLGAIEALLTYDRVNRYRNDNRLRSLTNCVFNPLGGMPTSPADDRRLRAFTRYPGWPTYPVLKLAGIPFILRAHRIEIDNGDPQFFCMTWQLATQYKDWSFLVAPINPPDDPFVAVDELVTNKEWKSLDWHVFPNQKEYANAIHQDLRLEVLKLTATVFDWKLFQLNGAEASPLKHFDEFHKEFLRLGGHWDKKLQMYVRRDGSHL